MPDLDAALDWAARMPNTGHGTTEVRAVQTGRPWQALLSCRGSGDRGWPGAGVPGGVDVDPGLLGDLAGAKEDWGELAGEAGEAAAGDDRLAIIFACCHPAFGLPVRVAMTLRYVAGLTTPQIAAASASAVRAEAGTR